MSRYFVIILILWGVWQAIGSMLDRTASKQRNERLRELAEQRQRQLAARARNERTAAGHAGAGGQTGTRHLGDAGVIARSEALAARRKAQLEELRRRRLSRHAGPPQQGSGQAVLRPTPTGTPGLGHPVPPTRVPRTPATARTRPGTHPIPVTRRPAATPSPPATAPPTKPPPPAPRRRAPMGTPEQLVSLDEPGESHSVFTHIKPMAATPVRRRQPVLDPSKPMDAQMLRKMIVVREILDPPVALRDQQVWER